MSHARYQTDGPWFKGNTHIHSTCSDGGLDYRQLAELYAGAEYDFLFFTDHMRPSTASSLDGLPLLALDGVEIDGTDGRGAYYHVVGLGVHEDIAPGMAFEDALGLLSARDVPTVLAHPHWTGNSVEEALRHGFDGVEVHNEVCRWLNGKSGGAFHWDCMLDAGGDVLGFAADDAHLRAGHPTWNGGWIVVSVAELKRGAVQDAVRRGEFYSSCGPEIHAIQVADGRVRVRTSPVREVRVVGPKSQGARVRDSDGGLMEAAELMLAGDVYQRLEVEDQYGRRAWTNALMRP